LFRITIIAVGSRMPEWIQTGFAEYKKRLSHELAVELVEVTPARRSRSTITQRLRQQEAGAILDALPQRNHVIALDETGKRQTTLQLSARLQDWIDQGINISLIIGGADGLDDTVLDAANERWSLSDFTFPHALVRVILIEQLYRAWSILKNHPYHRE
jgi:23S rRNA (pseudouridine1915-N3)-methyltransferase